MALQKAIMTQETKEQARANFTLCLELSKDGDWAMEIAREVLTSFEWDALCNRDTPVGGTFIVWNRK